MSYADDKAEFGNVIARDYTKVSRAKSHDGTVTSGPEAGRGYGDSSPPASGSKVDLEGATDNGFRVAAGQLTPTSVIKIDGMEVSVAVAEQLGLVEKAPQGGYRPAGYQEAAAKGEPQQRGEQQRSDQKADEQQKADAADPVVALDEASEVAMSEAIAAGRGEVAELGSKVINSLGAEDFSEGAIERLAAQSGKEPAEVRERVAQVSQAFYEQAVKSVAKGLGGNAEHAADAWQWYSQEFPAESKRIASQHFSTGKVGGYQQVARAYVEAYADLHPDHVLSMPMPEGWQVGQAADGTVLLRIPGKGELTWRGAVKAGLVGWAR